MTLTETLSQPRRITVPLGEHPSEIWIGAGLAENLQSLLDTAGFGQRRFLVSNPTIWKYHGEAIQHVCGNEEVILIPDGERHKTVKTVSRIYEALIRNEADRASSIVAVGGGVVGDTAGFAAATFLRGVTLAHVPTTLLAQVDSSIGGKVGVNHKLGKNLIGAFHQPTIVIIDPLLLETLPRREFRSGLYEIVKYGMIASRNLLDSLASNTKAIFARDPAVLLPIITESCRIKVDVVTKDERESGPRRVLNFGHTVGHALEAVTNYRRFRHGEAIAYGMLAAADLAVERDVMADRERQVLTKLIKKLGRLPKIDDLSQKQILETIRHDKKVVNGRLHFVMCPEIGTTSIVDNVTENELLQTLKRLDIGKAENG